MIACDRTTCMDFNDASRREWLETNGIGGYCSSTIAGINTRRYHGLLVAARPPALERMVLVAKLEEALVIDGVCCEFSANQYPGVIHPQGYRLLKGFRLDPYPVFTFSIGDVELEKSVFMVHGENTTVVQYRLIGPVDRAITLEIRPLLAFRDHHTLSHENPRLNTQLADCGHSSTVQLYPELPPVHFAFDAARLETTGHWYRNFEYEQERKRGFDLREDLFNPFALFFNLSDWRQCNLIVSTEPHDVSSVEDLRFREGSRRQQIGQQPVIRLPEVQALARAADQYLISHGGSVSVVAGYHWFDEREGDSMISLPGLALATGRIEDAKKLLRTVLNRWDSILGGPNDINARLWLFQAAYALFRCDSDDQFLQEELYTRLCQILRGLVLGSNGGICLDEDGMLTCGETSVQLEDGDRRTEERGVTPRSGKLVEIQALWYNALRIVETFARRIGDRRTEEECAALAHLCYQSFNSSFWSPEEHCLSDCLGRESCDDSIRSNQIFAVSLPFPVVPTDRAMLIVDVVTRELLTPYGLRTLTPRDPRYRGNCGGGQSSRDDAYQNGAVWPWLIGPYISAYVKTHSGSAVAREHARALLDPLLEYMSGCGLGSIPEVFDGDPPHEPHGCIAHASSTAEVLRALCEDVCALRGAEKAAV